MEDINKQIGLNLKRIRKKLGLNQTEMASVIGVSFQQVQKYESGINRITLDKAIFYSKEFNFDIRELAKGI